MLFHMVASEYYTFPFFDNINSRNSKVSTEDLCNECSNHYQCYSKARVSFFTIELKIWINLFIRKKLYNVVNRDSGGFMTELVKT